MPSFRVNFLAASNGTRLTKTKTTSYPHVLRFDSSAELIDSLADLREAFTSHASEGHCVLKGRLDRPLQHESRAGHTQADEPTNWICLDIDGAEGFVPLSEGYVEQLSASDGLPNKPGEHKHLFFLLAELITPARLRDYLMYLNLSDENLRSQISLTKTAMTLHWPVDVTVGQNDKLIYITPRPDQELRFELISGPSLTIPADLPSRSTLVREAALLLAELREAAGLPIWAPDYSANRSIVLNPYVFSITGRKTARGFVYYNLNGGDSWAYYHPADDDSIMRNFKGEPSFVLRTDPVPPQYFVLRDSLTDRYYTAIYSPPYDLVLSLTASRVALNDFLKEHSQDKQPPLNYELRFEFDTALGAGKVDHEKRLINLFTPSQYLQSTQIAGRFPVIYKALISLVGDDVICYERFVNWLAFIVQRRKRPHTAWVFHGTQGTGKGLLFKHILRPIFGGAHCIAMPYADVKDRFNDWVQSTIIAVLDEADLSRYDQADGTHSRVKNLITEDDLTIRKMFKSRSGLSSNHVNLIIAANEMHPVQIPENDRRFNVCPRQETKLVLTDAEYEILEEQSELAGFVGMLQEFQVSEILAKNPELNEAKLAVQGISTPTIDDAVSAFKRGDLSYFISNLSSSQTLASIDARAVIDRLVDKLDAPIRVGRDDIRGLFSLCVSRLPEAPAQFTKMLNHHALSLHKCRIGGKLPQMGAETTWRLDKDTAAEWVTQRAGKSK